MDKLADNVTKDLHHIDVLTKRYNFMLFVSSEYNRLQKRPTFLNRTMPNIASLLSPSWLDMPLNSCYDLMQFFILDHVYSSIDMAYGKGNKVY